MFDFIYLTYFCSLVIACCVTHLYVQNIIELIVLLLLFVSQFDKYIIAAMPAAKIKATVHINFSVRLILVEFCISYKAVIIKINQLIIPIISNASALAQCIILNIAPITIAIMLTIKLIIRMFLVFIKHVE